MNFWMSKNSFYYKNQKNLVERIIYLFEASVLGNSRIQFYSIEITM